MNSNLNFKRSKLLNINILFSDQNEGIRVRMGAESPNYVGDKNFSFSI